MNKKIENISDLTLEKMIKSNESYLMAIQFGKDFSEARDREEMKIITLLSELRTEKNKRKNNV